MRNENAPQWIKLWIEKYCDDICLEDIHELYPDEEENELIRAVGMAFISALSYYKGRITGEEYLVYSKMNRDGKRLYKSFVKDIDQSFCDYELRVENGKKGGRPKKQDDNIINLQDAEEQRRKDFWDAKERSG